MDEARRLALALSLLADPVLDCLITGESPFQVPMRIYPAPHYTMGGIKTNGDCATSLPGLYAVGECASVGLHGANRRGGNALTETTVTCHFYSPLRQFIKG